MSNRQKNITWGIILVILVMMCGLMYMQYDLMQRSNDIIHCLENTACPHVAQKLNGNK